VEVNRQPRFFFPPPPLLILVREADWRERLRAAVERSGRKHSAIARDAGVAPETLSRILTATHHRPTFDTIVRIARAVNENVGWLLDERGFTLSGDEQKQLRKVVRFLDDMLTGAAAARRERHEPNAVPASATDIPHTFKLRGARLAYEAAGDSMLGAGIADRDLLYVKPTRSTREGAGRVVVCRIEDTEYARILDVRAGTIRLLSRNDRYPPIEVPETAAGFELIGIVVGRSGALP
jgi:SOS-response transcriptional repressor LexA